MAEKNTSITLKRYTSGFTYREYIAQIQRNSEDFAQYYERGHLSADDRAFFQRAGQVHGGFARLLVISEDWCPYAIRAVPVMARIAEAAGAEIRVFTRDDNPDIMQQFLNQGKFNSIPVAAFYTDDMKELCRWIEKPGTVMIRPDNTLPPRQDFQQESAREMRLLLAECLDLR